MTTDELIQKLKKSNLYAECPCGGEFKLSEAVLFDGTKPFPQRALKIQKQLQKDIKQREKQINQNEEALKQREKKLNERKKRAIKPAVKTTKAVNIGKSLEKLLPLLNDFKWELPDSRFLGDPIDLITFNGLSSGKIESINFIEVKSGNAKLNAHQKSIKDAIEDKKVSCKVF